MFASSKKPNKKSLATEKPMRTVYDMSECTRETLIEIREKIGELQNKHGRLLRIKSLLSAQAKTEPRFAGDNPEILEIKLEDSLDFLCADIKNAIDRMNALLDCNLIPYLAGRTEKELAKDITLTLKATSLVFTKRVLEFLNTIGPDDISQEEYITIYSNKEARDHKLIEVNGKLVEPNPYKPYFSQEEATNQFKPSENINTSSPHILGKPLHAVGELIRDNPSLREIIQVGVFVYKERFVAENNRGLAAASISGLRPIRLSIMFPEQAALNYYQTKLEKLKYYTAPGMDEGFLYSLTLASSREEDGSVKSTLGSSRKVSASAKNPPVVVPDVWIDPPPVQQTPYLSTKVLTSEKTGSISTLDSSSNCSAKYIDGRLRSSSSGYFFKETSVTGHHCYSSELETLIDGSMEQLKLDISTEEKTPLDMIDLLCP